MTKKHLLLRIFVLLLFCCLLSGCSLQDTLKSDTDYLTYKNLQESNRIDNNGYYNEAASGTIRVTFATNSHIEVHYFRNTERTSEIKNSICYVNPGDSLYISSPQIVNTNTNLYDFIGFEIWECKTDGTKKQVDWTLAEDMLTITVPNDYTGTEIMIEPRGEYRNRELRFYAGYEDDNRNMVSVGGDWYLNDEKLESNEQSINPVESFSVKYVYDSDKYFFISSSPVCFYQAEGVVVFKMEDSNAEVSEYTVNVYPYLTAKLEADSLSDFVSIRINQKTGTIDKTDKSMNITHLKYGDTVTVEFKQKHEFKENNILQLSQESPKQTKSGTYEYIFTVRGPSDGFSFDPSVYTYSHGSLQFSCNGLQLGRGTVLPNGSKIEYTVKSVDDGYWLPDDDPHFVIVDGESTKDALKSIRFWPKKQVSVSLLQPAYGGSVRYSVNGTLIAEDKINIYCGQIIHMEFCAWNGWNQSKKDADYVVNEASSQYVMLDGKNVDDVFTEQDSHKPQLIVILNNAFKNVNVSVSAPGMNAPIVENYNDQFMGGYETICNEKIGTDGTIQLSLSGDTAENGKTYMVTMTKKAQQGITEKSICYVKTLPEAFNFDIYSSEGIEVNETVYSSVEIEFDKKDASVIYLPASEKVDIKLIATDTNETLENGATIHNERRVKCIITPESGYWMINDNTNKNGIYQQQMTYSDYVNKINQVLETQCVPVLEIKLPNGDDYGTTVFTLDGEEVSGSVRIHKGQTLKMKYTLTDDQYEIKNDRGILGFTQDQSTIEITIDVLDEMNGTTIIPADFVQLSMKEGVQ